MAYSYKTSISFGLVYIPVTLHASVKSNELSFNLLDRQTLSRVQYKKTCALCDGRELKQADVVKGYEYEKDKYVVFEEKDFAALKTPKDNSITIEAFVDLAQIDPIYYDKPYYVAPVGGEKAYALLTQAMQAKGKAGIAKTVLGNKETLIALRVKEGKMLLNTLYFHDEVQANPTKAGKEELKDSELKMATAIIDGMSTDFTPEAYVDEYQQRVYAAVQAKISGKQISLPQHNQHSAADLMEALKLTLEKTQAAKKGAKQGAKQTEKQSKSSAANKKSVGGDLNSAKSNGSSGKRGSKQSPRQVVKPNNSQQGARV